MTKPYFQDEHITIYNCSYKDLSIKADHVICDPPFSDTTHDGQFIRDRRDVSETKVLEFESLTVEETEHVAVYCARSGSGWKVILSDSIQIPVYRSMLSSLGLITFQPVPCIITGMTCRLQGDGPSSWAVYANVARPTALHKWGTLKGAYIGPAQKSLMSGGKPQWLMNDIIRDYSRPRDTILDPFMGHGTTLIAAKKFGRKGIGVETNKDRCDRAIWLLRQEEFNSAGFES